MKTILSLFDHSGNWSLPYKENGYEVIQVDLKHGIDILEFDYKQIPNVYGVLAAPPCTDFSASGAQWWPAKDEDGRTNDSLTLVFQTLDIVDYFNPTFWALENPVGRLPKLVPDIGKPWYFDPWEFGDCYTKKTGLWGKFNKPEKSPCAKEEINKNGNPITKLGGKSERTKELRSITPLGFAWAFYNANK
jgi:hypothetical protein